jgi:hypothetical protein
MAGTDPGHDVGGAELAGDDRNRFSLTGRAVPHGGSASLDLPYAGGHL